MGYHRSGFDVVGVDIAPQPNFPFEFVQADALDVVDRLRYGLGLVENDISLHIEDFEAIHASPPCQAYSMATLHHGLEQQGKHPELIEPTRELLEAVGLPWVIENVAGAPIRHDLTLCGEMFGLRVHRHRYFETGGWFAMQPRHAPHLLRGALDNCHIEDGYARQVVGNYRNHADAGDAMGIDWMARGELAEAIPPAFTEFIGGQLLAYVGTAA